MERAAEFVRSQFEQAGAKAQIFKTAGHPIVYGETEGAENGLTALVYGHYDVQPPEPLDEWISPPFEPTVRDGYIYARGATDDKGQVFTHIKALEAWSKTVGRPPVNVKFVIEGEEEVGSDNLDIFLKEHKDLVKCGVAVISDTSQYAPGTPAITYGLRGILACEIVLYGPNRDLHSGVFGGSVANPCNMLARLVAKLHDDKQRVQIPGFYDDVLPVSAKERQDFAKLKFDEAAYIADLGVPAVCGEEGFTTIERRWARPTCDVNGIFGGYSGPGTENNRAFPRDGQDHLPVGPQSAAGEVVGVDAEVSRRQLSAGRATGVQTAAWLHRSSHGLPQPLHESGPRGDRVSLRLAAGDDPGRGLDPCGDDLPGRPGSRYTPPGLGPQFGQSAQSERAPHSCRLSPRHQGQRPLVERAGPATLNQSRGASTEPDDTTGGRSSR